MDSLANLEICLDLITSVKPQAATPRLAEFSEIFSCICPYACASVLTREKIRLKKVQDSLQRRQKAARSLNFQVPESLKASGLELRAKLIKLGVRREAVKEAADQIRNLRAQGEAQTINFQVHVDQLAAHRLKIERLKEEISRSEKNKIESDDLIAAEILKNKILEGDLEKQTLFLEEISSIKIPQAELVLEALSLGVANLQKEQISRSEEMARMRLEISDQVSSIRELENILTTEKTSLETKKAATELKREELEKLREKIEEFPGRLTQRRAALISREAEIAQLTVHLQRAAAVVAEAEESGQYSDDFGLKLSLLRQEESALNFETSENEKILKSLKEERRLFADENRRSNRLLVNFKT